MSAAPVWLGQRGRHTPKSFCVCTILHRNDRKCFFSWCLIYGWLSSQAVCPAESTVWLHLMKMPTSVFRSVCFGVCIVAQWSLRLWAVFRGRNTGAVTLSATVNFSPALYVERRLSSWLSNSSAVIYTHTLCTVSACELRCLFNTVDNCGFPQWCLIYKPLLSSSLY